jgi:hypothetical protein
MVHVYSGSFPDWDAGAAFAEESYDEDGNASSALWTAIGARHLDHDFVEVIHGHDRFDYLESLLCERSESAAVRTECRPVDNTLFLIFAQEANEHFTPRATEEPRHVGTYRVRV